MSSYRAAGSALGTVIVAGAALTLVLGGSWLLYQREASQIAQRQTEREVTRVNLLSKLMQSELRPVTDDLRLLADGDGLRNYLETGRADGLQAALRRARFFSEHKLTYDQIRFIDQSGQEVLRVNQGGQVLEATQLQSRADAEYFLKTSRLPSGSLYLSDFDLTVEHGQVERPIRPILRFAVPLFDSGGQRRGIYVINYRAEDLISRMIGLVPLYSHRLRMFNGEGYWLKADVPEKEWGFLLPERAPFSLARTDPALWGQIRQESFGQVQEAGGLFTWRRLSPAEFAGVPADGLHADEAFIVMASEVSPSEWTALFTGLRQIMLIVATVLAVLTLVSVVLFRVRARR